ncbi:conjugative transposon protein TraK [Gaoshiqia sp. Z1-71]|uniref:conjugative transposon protein TraK n=1 Tax=Gaoshiqia hydrogeniformans TaxID=3290090 RepID=UPI003BF8C19C
MPIVKNIESKIRLATTVSILSVCLCLSITVILAMFFTNQLSEARKTIYILDKDVPILAKQTDQEVNRPVEYKAHVDLFHSIFFTITPDNQYIEYQMKKAMYLIDESGMQQYNSLKEKGYYNQVLLSSAVLTIETDSILLDYPNRYFRYYGRQRIDRKSSTLTRSLVTEGYLKDVPRSANNPHGVLIVRWKTLENKDLKNVAKRIF